VSEQPRAVWCCSTCGAIYHKDFPRCPADGAEVVMAERDPLLGTVIGHYTIVKLIGEGGMGRVYLAHHANLPNKRYAFKVLLGDHSASTAMRTRFTREAERASQLDHPNVVKVVDFGQTQHGLLYIVMDYVEGPSLVALIGDVPMSPARAIALTREICKGLVHAHAAGIVHRDLKPENILVSSGPDGEVPRIVDFGLAMSLEQGDARLTESGMTMGTPAFAAPEQISGKPIDRRADLYALGMSMFEMLTGGMTPFEGHMMEMVSARTTRDAPRISERAPHLAIPRELEDVVARLTRRKPTERYASAREVIEALDGVRLGPEARIATESLEVARPWRWGRIAAGLIALGALAVAARYVAPASDGAFAVWPPSGYPAQQVAVSDSDESAELIELDAPAEPAESPRSAASPAEPSPASDVQPATPSAPVRSATPIKHRHRPQREPRERAARPAVRVESAAIAPTAPQAAALALLRPAAPPSIPAPLRELRAQIEGVEVAGSLPAGAVQRAIERRRSAIERCAPAFPEAVVARFTIGEARRARAVRVAGPTAETNACISAAFTDVRTEAAPDVGDVEVTVRIAFVVKT
jgi:eukaryotic-like serine/threonine-protein kinase